MQASVSFYVVSDFINLVLCVFSLYGAYHNLILNKISDRGADAALVYIIGLIDNKQSKLIQTNQKLIFRMGFVLSLIGIGALFTIVL